MRILAFFAKYLQQRLWQLAMRDYLHNCDWCWTASTRTQLHTISLMHVSRMYCLLVRFQLVLPRWKIYNLGVFFKFYFYFNCKYFLIAKYVWKYIIDSRLKIFESHFIEYTFCMITLICYVMI